MASLPGNIAAYLGDSVRVFLFPATTIREAADRNLPWGQILGVAVFLVMAINVVDWAAFRLIQSVDETLATPLDIGITTGILTFLVLPIAYIFVSGAILFGLTTVMAGQGTARHLYSAFLVLVGFTLATTVLRFLLVLFMWWRVDNTMGGSSELLSMLFFLLQIGPVVASCILLSYAILASRFGGVLGYGRATLAAFAHLVVLVAFDMLRSEVLLGSSRSPVDIMSTLYRVI